MRYDYLIVGAGLFGSVFAYEANKRSKRCLIIDKRDHIGGNVYTEKIGGIYVHRYGAHIFHTDDKLIWDYINRFGHFNNYINSPVANYKGEIYNLPFNMNTFSKLWGVATPEEAKNKIDEQKKSYSDIKPSNLEEQAISLVGTEIYEKIIKGYTEKQWGRPCKELPAFIIKRLPLKFIYDNNYFNDKYQGIPIDGYTEIIIKMLEGIDIELNVDFYDKYINFKDIANKLVFTGMIDEYFNHKFGVLEYRSLEFKTERLDCGNYQGVAVMNYTDSETPHTRIIEHKHFAFNTCPTTVITKEYPRTWSIGDEPFYPINDNRNSKVYKKYREAADKENDIIFGGRLGSYKYYDMDEVILAALKCVDKEFGD